MPLKVKRQVPVLRTVSKLSNAYDATYDKGLRIWHNENKLGTPGKEQV